ncbi:SH3 and cysteine-rich domain-containing protein [Tachyglossus aculeatus]|uniref:SH3 and cysteine-rich domain-containing protein n=1 Tax=Tachyglossus aculeatus TaxID=9261 RepID=UPI0018F3792C|nr:SH3 and cysteine-rich domain-containing protein [Tachyglossus aculeatus]
MIPPSGSAGGSVDGVEKERELKAIDQPPSPASSSGQESKLQKLKRSLSFKTKSLRSKSADNFFQRTNHDVRLQMGLLPEARVGGGRFPDPEGKGTTPARVHPQPEATKVHAFQDHVFKKPTFCDVCNHMIVGTTTKHGLRCKACKMSVHHKCTEGLSQQRCMGKLPKGFRRYYSSPLLIHEQFGCIKEVMPIACGNKVDPVYETLRFGTSLAQKTKRGSSGTGSDSPNRNSTSDLVEVPEEVDGLESVFDARKRSNSVFTYSENGTDDFKEELKGTNCQVAKRRLVIPAKGEKKRPLQRFVTFFKGSLCKDPFQVNTYVALYKFVPQESEDLEMRPGDMITLLEDSSEDWWKGMIQDRIGYFPANFVQKVQQDEKVFRCVRTFTGCKEQGQITLKENQICVTSEEESDGFIRVSSGKKRGLVPLDVLENI